MRYGVAFDHATHAAFSVWMLPAVLSAVQLFIFGNYLPHCGDAVDKPHRANSNAWPELVSLVTCFHFGGYHEEHHRFPDTPWYDLPRHGARPSLFGGRPRA